MVVIFSLVVFWVGVLPFIFEKTVVNVCDKGFKTSNYLVKIEEDAFSTPFKAKDFEKIIESSISNVLVATQNGVPIGHISYTVILDECQIINVAVSRNMRGQGIGSLIMEHFIMKMRQNGISKVFLEVRASNSIAIGLYEKLGFSMFGERKSYYKNPTEDACLYRRDKE